MSRQWKPGDVAMATYCGESAVRVSRYDHGWARLTDPDDFVNDRDAMGSFRVADVRPLVVIDPEDSDLPVAHAIWEALDDCGTRDFRVQRERIRDALRSLIAPPKPEEPLGLGAVVEDAEGNRWLIVGGPQQFEEEWYSPDLNIRAPWSKIAARRVLSEGVVA